MKSRTGISIFGAEGKMGTAVHEVLRNEKAVEWIKDLKAGETDVVIDFSSPEGALEAAAWCVKNKIPLVTGTTGFKPDDFSKIQAAGNAIPVLHSPNMSLGIQGLAAALNGCLKVFRPGEAVVEEIHHNKKKDAPSGTAKFLNDILKADGKFSVAEPVSVRGGDVFGVHRVLFFSEGEWLSFEHHATGRNVFAKGAVSAALWLVKQKPGFYTMRDMF